MTCLRDRLVADWATIAKFWSVRWAALGAVLLPVMQLVPTLPPEVQAILPLKARMAVNFLWCVIYIALRAWPQKNLNG